MPHGRRSRYLSLVLSLGVTLVVSLLLSLLLVPQVHKRYMVFQLTAADMGRREKALNYVLNRAVADPVVFHGAVGRLDVPDEKNFVQIYNTLDRAGLWRRPAIPVEAWMRWLTILGRDANPESRVLACQMAAIDSTLAAHPAAVELIESLSNDAAPIVRLNAVAALGEMAGMVPDSSLHQAVLAKLTDDPLPQIAAQAWLFLGLLEPQSGISVRWADQPPAVAQAVLWACLQTNPDAPGPAIEALRDQDADPLVRAMAAYVLTRSSSPAAIAAVNDALREKITIEPPALKDIIYQRMLLGLPPERFKGVAEPILPRTMLNDIWQGGELRSGSKPVVLTLIYRGISSYAHAAELLEKRSADPLLSLAALEGVEPDKFDIPIDRSFPPLLRIAATTVTQNPAPDDLYPVLGEDQPTLRDLACLVAAQRFTPEQNSELIERLLSDYDDHAKMSGAVLAGLTGLQPALLAKKMSQEDRWPVQQIQRLGLWMQDQPVYEKEHLADMDQLAPAMLTRDDLPTTTVLLALLHKGRPEALEYLLSPHGDERLFSARVLNLPDDSALDELVGEDADEVAGADGADDAGSEVAAPSDAIDMTPAPENSDSPESSSDSLSQADLVAAPTESMLPPVPLTDLLDDFRWWIILHYYLVQQADGVTARDGRPLDTPEYWIWADHSLQQFQVDVLRNWYLLHRRQLYPQLAE